MESAARLGALPRKNIKDNNPQFIDSLSSTQLRKKWDPEFAASTSFKEAWSHQPATGSSSGKTGSKHFTKKNEIHMDGGNDNMDSNIKNGIDDRRHSIIADSHLSPILYVEKCVAVKSTSVVSGLHDDQYSPKASNTWAGSAVSVSLEKEKSDSKADGWCVQRESYMTNSSQTVSSKSFNSTLNLSNQKEKDAFRKGPDEDQQCIIEDLEGSSIGEASLFPGHSDASQLTERADNELNDLTGKQNEKTGGNFPKIVVDGIGPSKLSNFRKREDASETRRRKLKMKMKHSNAFRHLFHTARVQSINAKLDLSSCYNPEGIKIAKTDAHRGQYVLSRPSMKSVIETESKLLNYGLSADSKQYMAPSESIKIMRETLNEKYQYLFGEQSWLLGRLALSKETSRFEVPMDLRIMEKMSPMNYLTGYCVIRNYMVFTVDNLSSRRKSLYKSIFHKVDKDRDGLISYSELIRAVKEIHVRSIDENEIGELNKILNLSNSSDAKYNCAMFAGVAAFSERLVIYLRSMHGKIEHCEKEKLESADFDNMKWKLRNVEVNPALMKVLQVL